MFEKKRNLELTYDVDGEAAVQQMIIDSYHAGHINQNQPTEDYLEKQ